MPSKIAIEITSGVLAGKRYDFDGHDIVVFGRHSQCRVRLPNDGHVSRHQFVLEVNPPAVCVRDLGSRNGTVVNNVRYGGRSPDETIEAAKARIYPTVPLADGDQIVVGQTTIVVRIQQAAAVTQQSSCSACGSTFDITPSPSASVVEMHLCPTCRTSHGDPFATMAMSPTAPQPGVAANAAQPAPGITVPGYDLFGKIGEGGMGVVYRGVRKSDGRHAAVKFMLSRSAVSDEARRVFLREINNLRQLRHTHIIELIDHGSQGGAFFFAAEFCTGGSARRWLREGTNKLPLSVAGSIMMQVLDGLAFAHARDHVHRDLKPENILLQQVPGGWAARIGDFGLAKNFQQAGFSEMTATGQRGGTLHFMPREQLNHFRHVRPVSDVWSAAATFFNLLTGKLPRDFHSSPDPVRVVLETDVTPVGLCDPSVPEPLAKVLDRALADDPDQRPQTAAEFLSEIQAALGARHVPTHFVYPHIAPLRMS